MKGHKQLLKSKMIFITLGTSFAHRIRSNCDYKVVSNCHKQPSKDFEKIMISAEHTVDALSKSLCHLKSVNTDCQVVLTVSPIRHTRSKITNKQTNKQT